MLILKYFVLVAGSISWCAPFVAGLRGAKLAPMLRDRKARWGIVLQCIAYSLLWQGAFWRINPGATRIALSISFFAAACLLSWTGAHALGRHLRLDAAIDSEQTLVRSGPYCFVRHPIYLSMLCVLMGTGLILTPWLLLLLSLLVFFVGTEIRIRLEDKLLHSCFRSEFERYRHDVRGIIPFIW